jgi:3-isopropylmalate dehydrogenase
MPTDSLINQQFFTSSLPDWSGNASNLSEYVIGVLPGEGIGPEIIRVTLDILEHISKVSAIRFDISIGGKIGLPAKIETGNALSQEVIEFCQSIFSRRGAVLCGPGGGRFVSNLRAHFDLFCKFTPIRHTPALDDIGAIRPSTLAEVDMVVVRENTGGLYFGEWGADFDFDGSAHHHFEYKGEHVKRILKVAIVLASMRRNKLSVVLKPDGIPSISELWQQKLDELAVNSGVDCQVLEVDNAMYQIIANARSFDVIVAPNMFGDILSDEASLLLGSRGLSFSGNFDTAGHAVYQTGHGAAHDLAGSDTANPIGQIFSLAMMLRESFGMHSQASAIELAIAETLRDGWRTADIAAPGSRVVGTREMGMRIGDKLKEILTASAVGS